MKSLKSLLLSTVVVASLLAVTSAASAHPLVNIHNYSSFDTYKTALDKQLTIDLNNAHDQWELDAYYKQHRADIATATVFYKGMGTGESRLSLVNYTTYPSYKAELDKLLTYDWNHAFDQFELDRIRAQYDADIAAEKMYFEV
ncbi:hypothetical protein SAMN04487970_105151 [Paenibacillus tianmuensis]|uniref:Uncharacterized protein n=1 Tax=Paenibacillus tianmuensis TaxID=624147 RepID=A0A1G4TGG1_9BACL|nr:hypothetical protein [Paenibacillus tianmuensis]SCW80436.1 hypothetical protein SAMN04487970_105151 [Paenibacillus tianmuensis]